MAIHIELCAPVDPAIHETIASAVRGQKTLEDVVRWGLLHTPPLLIADVIVQDEYTHDVVMPYRGGLYIVYDTT